jgi:hypothetical protein
LLISDTKQRTKLESKDIMLRRLRKAGLEATSPDDGDALALTFAMPVAVPRPPAQRSESRRGSGGWME